MEGKLKKLSCAGRLLPGTGKDRGIVLGEGGDRGWDKSSCACFVAFLTGWWRGVVCVCVWPSFSVCVWIVCLCGFVCVRTYACMHVFMYACMHVCMYVGTYIYMRVCMCVCACIHAKCMRVCIVHNTEMVFQLLCAVRSMLDYRTPTVGGIPGLTYNTDSNQNAGNRIE